MRTQAPTLVFETLDWADRTLQGLVRRRIRLSALKARLFRDSPDLPPPSSLPASPGPESPEEAQP
jgi:hypothetical protein